MSHSSTGFKGTVDQVAEAKRLALLGPRFRVASANDWTLSLPAATRTVRVGTGSAEACGVRDTTGTFEDIVFAANGAAQDRYDLLVSRFLWTDPITQPAFAVVQGVAGAGAPNIAGLVRSPGTQYDAVLGCVKVRPGITGAFIGSDLFPLAPTGGVSGPLVVPQASFLAAVDGEPGNELIVAATGRRYRHDGTDWVPVDKRIMWRSVSFGGGSQPVSNTGANETGSTSGIAGFASFTLLAPTRVAFIATFRMGPSTPNTGAALGYIKVDGAVASSPVAISRINDISVTTVAGLDLAAGTHSVALRVEAFGGDVAWAGANLLMHEGAVE